MLHKIFSGVLLLTLFIVAQADAQPNSITLTSTLSIVQPISITKIADKDLLFGKFAAYTYVEGTVVLGTDGQRTPSPGISLLTTEPFGAAQFRVSGLANATFDLTLPTEIVLNNTLQGSDDQMLVTDFVTTLGQSPAIGPDGTVTFEVGATLNKTSESGRGTYTGFFDLTVNYR